jgi:hypothetical protein
MEPKYAPTYCTHPNTLAFSSHQTSHMSVSVLLLQTPRQLVNPLLEAQLERLGKTLSSRNNQPVELFGLGKRTGEIPRQALKRPAEPLKGSSSNKYRSVPPPSPSEVISARGAVAEALSYNTIRTALYCTKARDKLIAEAQVLSETLRACAPPVKAGRSDRRAAVESLHTELVTVALAVKQSRGHVAAGQITIHQGAELLAEVMGISDASLYRYLPLLREVGLIDYRGNKSSATVEGESCTRADGTLIAVSLRPETWAKLSVHDFGTYRDLDADREAGRTAYRYRQQLRQSLKTPTGQWSLKPLVIWALAPGHFHSLPLDVTLSLPTLALETILDVPGVDFMERCKAVELAAGAVAANLADGQSHRFWCDVLWRLLRLHDQGRAEGSFGVVYNVVKRCVIDRREGFARRPGALAQSRLKHWAGWEELRYTGLRPVAPSPHAKVTRTQ